MKHPLNNVLEKVLGIHVSRSSPKRYGFFGNYPVELYDSLRNEKNGGYNHPETIEKLRQENIKNPQGDISFQLLSSLLIAKPESVVDFGGAFGKAYRTLKEFLSPTATWSVLEQPSFVANSAVFLTDHLSFSDSSVLVPADFFLASCSLPYLRNPLQFLQKVQSMKYPYICIDRTMFVEGPQRLTIQKITPKSYDATYPVWFLNRNELAAVLTEYEAVYRYQTEKIDLENAVAYLGGILFRRKRME